MDDFEVWVTIILLTIATILTRSSFFLLGGAVKLPPKVRDAWWEGTTRQWPFMAADLGCSMETVMAHYLSNHIAVAYGDIFGEMVSLSQSLGFKVRVMSGK